jgi:YggT family protein
MVAILSTLIDVISLYMYVVVVSVIFSWLIAFNVVNTQNRFVYTLVDILHRLTEPLLGRIRRILPDLGGMDLSPIVLIFGLVLLQRLIAFNLIPAVQGY